MNLFSKIYNREDFLNFISDSFLPEDFEEKTFEIELTHNQNFTTNVFRLGKCKSLGLEVFEVHHSSVNNARVGISKDAFQLLLHHSYCNRALIAFVPSEGKQWRISLIQIEAEINDKTGRITRGYTNPRRFSFLVGEGASVKTPVQFLIEKGRIRHRQEGNKQLTPDQDLLSRFSVEALTKEFYDQLYNWYLWAVEPSTGITFPNMVNTSKDDRDEIAVKIIRLITRLLFVWFIKQKKLVPAELFDEKSLKTILSDFDPQAREDGQYYNAILQNLFFATLNNEIGKRRFTSESFMGKSSSFGVKNLFRDSRKKSWFAISHEEVLKLFHSVPFMNCGLFECLDKYAKSDIGREEDLFLDGFSSRDNTQDKHFKYRAFIPNRLFFAEEHREIVTVEENKKPKKVEINVMGLLPLLKLYNFTVQENTPAEVEVSLDPELLGQVFENLLAAYNPETKESARKSTGSFYTPRPIVEYMVNESLVEYLKTKVPSVKEDNWRALISYDDKPFELNDDEQTAALNALYECKVLDPACGSGAFPMGMLQQILQITRKLDSEFDPYQTKLRIINNCIYGSDIQPIAMLISKLRFFISLICEQDEKQIDFEDEANNYGINTLPNLETKFVAANSLLRADIHNYADDDWTQDSNLIKLKNELLEIRKSHFSVRTQTTKLKKREEDRLKREEIQKYIFQTTSQPDAVKIQMYEARINHLNAERKLYEGEKVVEEIVNTQTSLFDDVQPQKVRKDVNKIHRDKIDSEIKSLQQAIVKERNKNNPVGFNAAIKQITDWNPYDQLKAAPFFDPDWMFGISDGFDIVIGNPPYGATLSEQEKTECKNIYITSKTIKGIQKGSLDTYTLFIEMGYNMLKHYGVLTYIVPISFTSSESLTGVHKLLMDNCCYIKVSSYAVRPEPVFPNAVVNTSIIKFEKTKTACQSILTTKLYRKKGNEFSLKKLVDNLEFVDVQDLCLYGRIPKIGTVKEKKILRKILGLPKLNNHLVKSGYPIYYRFAGGRYFKVVTNYSTGSSAEKAIYFNSKEFANAVGCILSSNLSFWFYQIFSDNLNWKSYEIENFTIPILSNKDIDMLNQLYDRYLQDIEANANIRKTSEGSTYNIASFKEYKIVRSKAIIDEIDDYICPLYGLSEEEKNFIKNYELEFRMAGDE